MTATYYVSALCQALWALTPPASAIKPWYLIKITVIWGLLLQCPLSAGTSFEGAQGKAFYQTRSHPSSNLPFLSSKPNPKQGRDCLTPGRSWPPMTATCFQNNGSVSHNRETWKCGRQRSLGNLAHDYGMPGGDQNHHKTCHLQIKFKDHGFLFVLPPSTPSPQRKEESRCKNTCL